MNTGIQQPALQQQTLRLYGELLCRETEWSGKLTFAAYTGAAASGLAAASSLAGAASLTIDSNASAMKAHFRDGAFDFVVTALNEALRALKNEVRQRRPIAIGLILDPETALAEAVERGLAAQLVLRQSVQGREREVLSSDGVLLSSSTPSTMLGDWLERNGWEPGLLERWSTMEVEAGDPRQRWLAGLPTHQRSATRSSRWAWVGRTT